MSAAGEGGQLRADDDAQGIGVEGPALLVGQCGQRLGSIAEHRAAADIHYRTT